ncbi:O-antigen ligase family protein [Glaciimonas sp. Cout2]|uniref:O-antigen ligase family protein n=2 Tax=unclassified Glaciimonas TaxID=2644401 RepID=UPI002B233242|nr:O-antigen ligase family protein [Glaciimonas sp. Cout2]MEB0010616.1 O-antigen ligase family protein [Glaciimonas sp. Cout2]
MRYFKWLVSALLCAFFIMTLTVDRSAGVIFVFLLLFSLSSIVFIRYSEQTTFLNFVKKYWPLHLAMCGPLIAVFANQLGSGHFTLRNYDSPFRLAMFVLIFWVVSFLSIRNIKYLQWAFVVGAILSAIKIYILTKGGAQRYVTDFIPIIIFGQMALLLGIFSILSISWNKTSNRYIIFLKITALCSGLYVAYLSQSRGVWLTIPIFILLGIVVTKNVSSRYKFGVISVFFALLVGVSYFGNIVKDRVAVAETDISQYSVGSDVDTSLGIRLQLWRASWMLFTEHPLIGVGVEGFSKELHNLAKRKVITPLSATFAHSHNEILFTMSRFGVFGLLAILGLYFIPAYYFIREIRDDDPEVRYTAAMGAALTIGFFTLGLVDVVFLWWEVYPFYSISIALLLTYIIKRKDIIFKQRSDLSSHHLSSAS